MLQTLWNANATHRYILGIHENKVKTYAVTNAAQGQEQAQQLSEQGWDAYFAPAAFAGKRTQDDCEGVESLWLDLDVGEKKHYQTAHDALAAFMTWAKSIEFPQPSFIVHSGYGLHLYWVLDGSYPMGDWNRVAQHLKQALRVAQVHADPTRTADAASVLRVPGTNNYKDPDNPKPVRVLDQSGGAYSLAQIEQRLPRVGPQRPVRTTPADSEWSVDLPMPTGNAEVIADNCAQIRQVRDSKGVVDEPHWRAALSVLKRCEDSDRYIHEWSKGDDRYDPAQTQQKADATAGPATCAHFYEINPEGCAGCPWWGKITSPVQIQPAAPKRTREEQESQPWKVGQLGAFTYTDAGIYFSPTAKQGEQPTEPERLTMFPIWVREVEVRARFIMEQSESSIVLHWCGLDGKVRENRMEQWLLSDKRAFMQWMHENAIGVGVLNVPSTMTAINQLTRNLIQKRGTSLFYDRLGWTPEGFVLGEQLITPKGIIPAKTHSSSRIVEIKPKGDLDSWCKAVRPLGHDPKFNWLAFSVLAGLGSPLLSLGQRQSAVISLVGPSGAGKTISAKLALSPFGDPDMLAQGSLSSTNAVERQLSACHHAPFMMDEITQFSEQRIGNLIFMAANGTGRDTLTQDRKMRTPGTWCNAVFTTSNQPILELAQNKIKEAQRRRVLELPYGESINKEDARLVLPAITDHFGQAALPFLQQVATLRGKMPELFDKVEAQLEQYGALPDANRFGLWSLTSAWIAGWIADKVGLFHWDYDRIVKSAIVEAHEAAEETFTDEQRATRLVKEWLAEHSKQICDWKDEQSIGMPVDDPVARMMSSDRVAIHAGRLKQALSDHRIPNRSFNKAFGAATIERKSVRLAPGTPALWAIIMDSNKLGFQIPTEQEG